MMAILTTDQDHFLTELERIVTNKHKVKITRDAGWYSESEMKTDLNWSQTLSGSYFLSLEAYNYTC